MKNILPPIKVGGNQKLLPSGVVVSKDGKYHYWQCTLSGLMTFAKPDYWVKIMAKYGTEGKLAKTYVCKKAQKLLDAGMSQADIIKTLNVVVDSEAKQARKEARRVKKERKALAKKPRKVRLKSFAVGKVAVEVMTDSGSIELQQVPVYPWQNDPNYFKGSGNTVLSIEDATKDSCALPNRFLDDECNGCPFYDRCAFPNKYTEKDWKRGRGKVEVVVKKINSFEE
jgi:hypothetical protein